jgi:deoxycytidylate deaminase
VGRLSSFLGKNMKINEKFIRKYLRLAKHIAEDENPCPSRHIGSVIVDPVTNRPKGNGYNGAPEKTPHPSSSEYMREVVWPQLTTDEISVAIVKAKDLGYEHNTFDVDAFVNAFGDKGFCPRKVVGCPSGQRLELCSCVHSEANAITRAGCDLNGCYIFCWCGVPCVECTKLIINSGIKKIFCVKLYPVDYSFSSRWLLKKAKISLEIRDPETLDILESESYE